MEYFSGVDVGTDGCIGGARQFERVRVVGVRGREVQVAADPPARQAIGDQPSTIIIRVHLPPLDEAAKIVGATSATGGRLAMRKGGQRNERKNCGARQHDKQFSEGKRFVVTFGTTLWGR